MRPKFEKQLLLAGIALLFSPGVSAMSLYADCEIVDLADHWVAYEKLPSNEADKFLREAWDQGMWDYVSIPNDYWVIDLSKKIAYAPENPDKERIANVDVSGGRIYGRSKSGLGFELDRATGRLKITKYQPRPDVILRGIPIGKTSTWTYQCTVSSQTQT